MTDHNWETECRGLGYMILSIHSRYLQAHEHMGGDSELLRSSITRSYEYVDGPLRELLGPA